MLSAGVDSFFSLDGAACGAPSLLLVSPTSSVLYINASSQGVFFTRLPLESVPLIVSVTSDMSRALSDG